MAPARGASAARTSSASAGLHIASAAIRTRLMVTGSGIGNAKNAGSSPAQQPDAISQPVERAARRRALPASGAGAGAAGPATPGSSTGSQHLPVPGNRLDQPFLERET